MVTNLTATQTSCPADTPANAATLTWNPPSSGSAVASYHANHFGESPPKYIWSRGETVPAGYAAWSAGNCTLEGGITVCAVTFDSLAHGEHTFSVTARTSNETTGHGEMVSVDIGECTSTTGTTETADTTPEVVASPPPTPQGLAAEQISETLDAVVTWSPVTTGDPTGYSVDRNGTETRTLAVANCGTTCSMTFTELTYTDQTFKVSAVSDAGTSAASAGVTLTMLPPLTVAMSAVPTRHEGRAFTFNLRFSENVKLGFRKLRNRVLNANNGGNVARVKRVTRKSNQEWLVTVTPAAGHSDATIDVWVVQSLSCTHSRGVCTYDERLLTNAPSVSVPY